MSERPEDRRDWSERLAEATAWPCHYPGHDDGCVLCAAFREAREAIRLRAQVERLLNVVEAARDGDFDATHYWRCRAWQDPDVTNLRRTSDPMPDDERCDCGLRRYVAALRALEGSGE